MSEQHQLDRDNLPYHVDKLVQKPAIDAAWFFALDLRVGRIVEVNEFPQARQPAWQLQADFGPHVGMLQTSAKVTNYAAEELVGRHIVGAINIGTKRIAGFVSEFLLLGALQPDGTVNLLGVDGDLSPGAAIA